MKFQIDDRWVGEGQPVFIIAELSANHLGDFDRALQTIEAAADAGVDAIKLQTYTADTITLDCDTDYFQIKQGTIWDGNTFYKLYQQAFTPWEWQPELKLRAEKLGLICFSSPFDRTAVDFLEEMNVPAYKVASFEITDIPLIEYIASKGKPVIISTGIAHQDDIEEAKQACLKVGNKNIAFLKCTSAYPAPLEEVNLKTIPAMAQAFETVVGLSDHTLGISVPIAATALGAQIIEKHIILDRSLGGPDAAFSLEPAEFQELVLGVRAVEKALGTVTYELSERSQKAREFARSLFVAEDIAQGEPFTAENVRSIRPGYGLSPKYLTEVLGKEASSDLKKGTPFTLEMIAGD